MSKPATDGERIAASKAMGEAVGSLAAFIAVINQLADKIERLDARVQGIEETQRSGHGS